MFWCVRENKVSDDVGTASIREGRYATQVAVVNPKGLNVSTAFPFREQNNGTSVT